MKKRDKKNEDNKENKQEEKEVEFDAKEAETIEVNDNKPEKINFFKKVWYSIAKISKYEKMREEGVLKAVKYFFALLGILGLIIAIFSTFLQVKSANKQLSYLEENLPEMSFKDNTLTLNNSEATILDDSEFISNFRSVVVINPLIDKDKAITEYYKLATEYNNVVVFLSNDYIVIYQSYNPEAKNEDGIEVHHYSDEASKYIKDEKAEYGKAHVIEYLRETISFTYYIAQYFVVYVILIGITFILYIILISISLWLVTKISKVKWDLKKSLMNTIYSITLSMIVYVAYMIISYFAKFSIPYTDILIIVLIYIYLFILLYKERKSVETNKKVE